MAATATDNTAIVERSSLQPAGVLEGLFASVVLFVGSGAVFPLLRRLGGEGTVTVSSGGPEGRIYMAAFVMTAAFLYPIRARFVEAVRRDWVLWALPAMAFASVVWSTDHGQSLKSSVALLGAMLFGAYFALRFAAHVQLRILAFTLGLVVIASIGAALIPPYLGIDQGAHVGAWRGIYGHKNGFGRVMVLAFGTFLVLALYRPATRVYSLPFAAASMALVWLSHSRTSLVVAMGVLCFLATRPVLTRFRVRAWLVAFALIGIVAILGYLAWSQRSAVIQRDPEAETLTGRTVLWAVSLLKASARPLLGYGFDAFWNGGAGNYNDVWQLAGWRAPNAHNAFIDVALDLGVIGLALFLWAFVRTITRSIALYRDVRLSRLEQAWSSAVIVFILLAFLTEGQLFANHAYWMLFTSAAVFASTRQSDSFESLSGSNTLPIGKELK